MLICSTDTDLCPFTFNYCLSMYCPLCTFTTHLLAQLYQTVFNVASLASIASSIYSLLTLIFPSGSQKEVGGSDVRCRNWLNISHSLDFSLLSKGFYHTNCHLSVFLGDSTSPLELWSSNSFTLSPDGFLGPLRSSNFASDCGSILYIGSGATCCVGSDNYICQNPLPNTCIHSMSSILHLCHLTVHCT